MKKRSRHERLKDKKRIEILLKVIKRIYDKNPEMQKSIDSSMIAVCKEGVSLEQVFFILLFFAAVFIIMGSSRKNPNKRIEGIKCFVCEGNNLILGVN